MEQKFSVLLNIDAKDHPVWIKQALDSVLTNTVRPPEIVIMVDGPTSKEIQTILDEASKNKTVRIFSHNIAYGRAEALSFAIPKCSYDLIALHSADSISLPDRFEKQLSYFKANPETVVLGGWGQEIDGDTLLPTAILKVPEKEPEIKTLLRRKSPFIYRTVMFKKQAVLAAGNCKPFGVLEDEHLWVRLIGKGYKTANLPDILTRVRSNTAYYTEVMRLPYFQMKKGLFEEMHRLGLISKFTYYRLLCACFIKYLFCPNWLLKMFPKEYEF